MSNVEIVSARENSVRKMRRPKNPFITRSRPFQIQPFFIHPVLAGETLKSMSWKGRIVSDPLAGDRVQQLTPWWCEQFIFYVKLRDLGINGAIEAMMLQGTPVPQQDGANAYSFHADATTIDWTVRAYQRCVAEYFRDEGAAVNAYLVDGVPAVHAFQYGQNFFENMAVDGAVPTGNDLQNPHDDVVRSAELEQYERMRAMRLVNMSFEDWLGTYGVKVAEPVEANKPEVLRYTSTWHYPTNTVEPSTGVPSTSLVMSTDESADLARFFREPGFLIGLHVFRPKLYPRSQSSAGVVMLNDAYGWLPALLRDRPEIALKEFTNVAGTENGPFLNQTTNYWLDRRDLFIHGDHYRNWTPAASGSFIDLPTAGGDYKSVTDAQARSFFKDNAGGGANYIYYDGMVHLNILGHPTTTTDQT